MQKLIDGKLYDTDEAERIASWSNIADRSNFNYCREELYRTESGRWFLYGSGGAKSKYAETTADGRTGGEDIRTVTPEEAFQWCQRKNLVEAAREQFSDRIEPA